MVDSDCLGLIPSFVFSLSLDSTLGETLNFTFQPVHWVLFSLILLSRGSCYAQLPFFHSIPLIFYKYTSNVSEDMVRISVLLSTSPLFPPEFTVFSTPLILRGYFSYALSLLLPPALCVWEFLTKSSHWESALTTDLDSCWPGFPLLSCGQVCFSSKLLLCMEALALE